MAISENYIDKITKDGDSRIISPSADNVRVDNENFEGADLDAVLDEVAQAIEDAGSGNGTVTGVKMNDGEPIEPDEETGVVDLGTVITSHQSLAALFGKVAYDGTTHRINFYGKDDVSMATVLGYIDCSPFIVDGMLSGVEVKNVTISGTSTLCMVFSFNTDAGKQDINIPVSAIFNAANYYTKTDADGRFQLKLVSGTNIKTVNNTSILGEGNISIPAGVDGVTPHIGANGNWWVGPESDSNNDTGVKAQGPQGATGSVTVSDGVAQITIVNNLTDGGGGDALSAEMGKQLKQMIDELSQGANIEVLDTLQSNSPSKPLSARQGKLIYDAIQLLVASIRPSAFWDGAPEFDWVGQVTTYNVTYNLTGCGKGTSPSVVAEGGTLVAVLLPNTGYTLDGVTPTVTNSNNVAVTHNTSYNSQTGSLTITVSNVQGALIIGATAVVLRTVDTTGLTNLSWDGPTSVRNGGTLVGKIEALGNYALPSSTPTISGTHGTVTWDSSTGQLTVANVTSNIGITASGQSAFSVNAALTNCTLDNTNGVMPGGTYEGTLSPKASDAPNATVTWGISSVVVKMGSSEQSATEVQNAYNSSTGEITVPNVTGNLYITAVAESSVKIYRGKGLTLGGYPSSDSKKANFCYIDDIVLPQGITPAANDVIHWQTGYKNNMLSNYRDPLTLTFIGSDGKCNAKNLNLNNSDCDFMGATSTGVSAQTLGRDVTINSSHISAFPNGFKIRASFFMNSGNTDIYDGAYLSYRRNGVELARLFTAEQGMTEGTERTIYPVTVERDASQVDYHTCFNAITGVFAGDKLYIKFVAKSGYKIDSIDVTMGGVQLSDVVQPTNAVVIDGVTGPVAITISSSANS